MKYLCLITVEEKKLNDMPKNEWGPAGSEALANDEEFRQRGHGIIAPALPPVQMAAIARVGNGAYPKSSPRPKNRRADSPSSTPGDLSETVHVVSKTPGARPIRELEKG